MKLTKNSVFVVIDIQEAFRTVIPDFEKIANRTATAVRGFAILGLPILVTEQYPKGLGKTAAEILSALPDEKDIIEKSTFSSFGETTFVSALHTAKVKQVVVCGLETHICVNQSVTDLLEHGFEVHLLNDCISSRNASDREVGIKKMTNAGAFLSSVEMAFFEILQTSKNEKFREIQSLIK